MTLPVLLNEPSRVDEPQAAEDFSEVFTQVAAKRQAVILRRNGADLAAVIPLEHLEMVREILARQENQHLYAQIDWELARKTLRPGQELFDGDEPKPF